jgi:hypothetical protein
MGMGKIRRKIFFSANPFCIFCGGSEPATTIEHCPPKAMFDQKRWPEGYEFAACAACNSGSSDQDLLISWMARNNYQDLSSEGNSQTLGLFKMAHRQNPGMIQKLLPSAVEARRTNREFGIIPPPGKTHGETGVVNITPEMRAAVRVFGKKLAKCLYFMHRKEIFPIDGVLMMGWFTNTEFVRKDGVVLFRFFDSIAGNIPVIERAGRSLSDRFSYKFSDSAESSLFMIQAMFGNSFGLIIFGGDSSSNLKAIFQSARMNTSGDADMFMVL